MKRRIVLLSLLLLLFVVGCGGPPTAEQPFGPGIDVNDLVVVFQAGHQAGEAITTAGTTLGLPQLAGLGVLISIVTGIVVKGLKK